MKKILGIIRVSTDRQETESQRYELLNYIKGLGYKESEIRWIEQKGASARKENKIYLDFIERIKTTILTENIKAVAMWHLNRLGRVEGTLIHLKEWFIKNNIQVYVKENGLILFDNEGNVRTDADMLWSLFANLVKQDTKEMFAKFERAKNRNVREGKWNGGAFGTMYGYTVDENNYIVPNPDEVEFVNRIYTDYSTGKYSMKKLIEEYTALGYTARGRKFTVQWMTKVLNFEGYTGKKQPNGRTFPKILSNELFAKCREVAGTKQVTPFKSNAFTHINLVSGLLKCPYCGANFAKKDSTHYKCYNTLNSAKFHYGIRCTEGTQIGVELIERLAWEAAQSAHFSFIKSNNKEQIEVIKKEIEIVNRKANILMEEKDKIEDKMMRLKDLYIEGEITKPQMNAKKAKFESEIKENKEQLNTYWRSKRSLESQIVSLENPDLESQVKAFETVIFDKDREEMKAIINQHIEKITVESTTVYDVNKDDGSVAPAKIIKIYMKNKKYNRSFIEYYRYHKIEDRLWMSSFEVGLQNYETIGHVTVVNEQGKTAEIFGDNVLEILNLISKKDKTDEEIIEIEDRVVEKLGTKIV